MSEMLALVKSDAEERMHKSVEAFKVELTKIRTGRAHPSLLEHITVPYYGNSVPINQVANITTLDVSTLGVTPWEKAMVTVVEKAIRDSDLGLNPANVGNLLRVPFPATTEERRKELVKVVRHEAEGAKIAIRNIRRDANHELKKLLKNNEISKDDDHRAQDNIQKLTDQFIAKVDDVLAEKEQELMEL
jgi:ribosome recycling factor